MTGVTQVARSAKRAYTRTSLYISRQLLALPAPLRLVLMLPMALVGARGESDTSSADVGSMPIPQRAMFMQKPHNSLSSSTQAATLAHAYGGAVKRSPWPVEERPPPQPALPRAHMHVHLPAIAKHLPPRMQTGRAYASAESVQLGKP